MQLTVYININPQWEYFAADYPATGEPGIVYRRDVAAKFGPNAVSESLLCYDRDGKLVGILNYFPNNVPFLERAGNFNVIVHPKSRRRGIGTSLLHEAVKRWPINFEQQRYSHSGARLIHNFLKLAP